MIGRLVGELIQKKPPQLLLDVNGVGYEIEASMTTFYELPEVGQRVVLLTHMVVREDAQLLYGFATEAERILFRHLIKINGVGAKLALTILSGMSGAELARCVHENNVAALVKLPGIGKKTAERLIIELRDKLKDVTPSSAIVSAGDNPVMGESLINPVEEAVSALIALGYKPQEASKMVRGLDNAELSSEDIIRRALQGAVKG